MFSSMFCAVLFPDQDICDQDHKVNFSYSLLELSCLNSSKQSHMILAILY